MKEYIISIDAMNYFLIWCSHSSEILIRQNNPYIFSRFYHQYNVPAPLPLLLVYLSVKLFQLLCKIFCSC